MAIVSFITQINLVGTPSFSFTDTSDYAGQGINLAFINGNFRIIDPNGLTIYNNTDFSPSGTDIDIALSVISQQTIIFTPVLGNYTIIYTVQDTNAGEDYTATNVYNYQYVQPVLEIQQTVDCINPLWSQVDVSNYVINGVSPTILEITNSLFYPVGSDGFGNPVVTTSANLSTGVFYRGCQTSELISTVRYDFLDGLQIDDVIEANKEFVVNCDYYCSILCCIQAQEQKMTSFRGNNIVRFKEEERIFLKVNSYVALIRLAIECGNGPTNQVSFYLDEIRNLTQCTSDCDCEGDDNSRVIGFGVIVGINGTNGVDGVDGSPGAAGENGSTILFNSTTIDTPINGAYQSLKSFTMPANTLSQAGDVIEILFTGALDFSVESNTGSFRLMIDSSVAHPKISPPTANREDFLLECANVFAMKALVTRITSTTVMIQYSADVSGDVDAAGSQSGISYQRFAFIEESITVSDLTLNSNLIDVQGTVVGPTTIVGKQLLILQHLKP